MAEENPNKYEVIVANISWAATPKNAQAKPKKGGLPDQMTLDIPESVLTQARKEKVSFNDVIESFCCNLLTKKHNREVYGCQVWLPLDK